MYTNRMHTVLKLKFCVYIYRVIIQVFGIHTARYNSCFAYVYTSRMYVPLKLNSSVYIWLVKMQVLDIHVCRYACCMHICPLPLHHYNHPFNFRCHMYTSRMYTVLKYKFGVYKYRVIIQVFGIETASYNSSFSCTPAASCTPNP